MTAAGTAAWGVALLAFWIVLSGRLDALHLGLGLLAVAVVLAASRPLLSLAPALVSRGTPRAATTARFLPYLTWLAGQILMSGIQVACVVLHPRMPIEPRVLRVRARSTDPLARLTLAQSITLTPGTVTLDVEGDELVVHALTDAAARSLEAAAGEPDMPRRVRMLFGARGAA